MTGCHGNAQHSPWLRTLYPPQDTLLWLFRQNTWTTTTTHTHTHTHAYAQTHTHINCFLSGSKWTQISLLCAFGIRAMIQPNSLFSYSCSESIKLERYLPIKAWRLNPVIRLWSAHFRGKDGGNTLFYFTKNRANVWTVDLTLSSLSGYNRLVSCKTCVSTSLFICVWVCVCRCVCECGSGSDLCVNANAQEPQYVCSVRAAPVMKTKARIEARLPHSSCCSLSR